MIGYLKKVTTLIFISMMFVSATAFANVNGGVVMETLTKATKQNPIVKSVRYKFPNANQKPVLEGLNGYYYFPSGADVMTYKDKSQYWLVVFTRKDSSCNGDFIIEYDASTKTNRITEFCRVHGKQEKGLEYLEDFRFIKAFCEKKCVAVPVKYAGYDGGTRVNVEDLNYAWIKSTSTTGFFYDAKKLKVNKEKKTVSADVCVWEPGKDKYTILGNWTFDYQNSVSYPSSSKEYRISDGMPLNSKKGKFGKVPFNLDEENKILESFFYHFLK